MTSSSIARRWMLATAMAIAAASAFQVTNSPQKHCRPAMRKYTSTQLFQSANDDDNDDEYINDDALGDWRNFRKNLASPEESKSVSKANENLLKSQNQKLAEEYLTGVWAHETSTPEIGGLVVRLPLEVELYRSYKHSINGQNLHKLLTAEKGEFQVTNTFEATADGLDVSQWYVNAQRYTEERMETVSAMVDDSGQIDRSQISEEQWELLRMYLHHQQTWQEVCLVLEYAQDSGTATTLVINRPIGMQLTDQMAEWILYGVERQPTMGPDGVTMQQFVEAFGKECAVYVGGDRNQDQPATLIHGIADLDGATEISPGTNIYRGGFQAAVDGVLSGKYTPLEFRFFVGSCEFHESQLDIDIRLGKVQPVACARSVALKQCISLPKPLWHEVLELCGGQLAHISSFELMKRDDLPHPKGREGVDVTRRADGYELQITKEMMTKALKRLADNGELAPDATFEDLTEAEKTRVAQILLAEANSDDQWDDDAGEKDEEDSAWE